MTRRHRAEQIVAEPRQADVALGQGLKGPEGRAIQRWRDRANPGTV